MTAHTVDVYMPGTDVSLLGSDQLARITEVILNADGSVCYTAAWINDGHWQSLRVVEGEFETNETRKSIGFTPRARRTQP